MNLKKISELRVKSEIDPEMSRRERFRQFAIPPTLFIMLLLMQVLFIGKIRANDFVGPEKMTVLRDTLKNGLQVVIVHNPLAPVVTTVMNYLVGSDEAPSGFPGTAHAQEHMMFRGSPGLSADQLANITAAMGGDFDAETQQTVTQYFFTVPVQDLDVALHIEAIRMRGVLDSDSLWNLERGAIEQEVARDLSNPEYIVYTDLLATMFNGTVYAHDALGTRPSFDKTTGAMLKNFHDTWYLPNNAILVIVGDINPEKTLSQVKQLFSDIPSKPLPAKPQIKLQPVRPDTIEKNTDLPYGISILAFRMPGIDSPDYAASQILSDVLNSQRANLYSLVPKGKALFAGFALNQLPKAGLGYAIAAYPKGTDGIALADSMKNVLQSYRKNGLPAELIDAAKRGEISDAEFQKNSVFGLAMSWSNALAVEGHTSPREDIEQISKVTVDQVNQVARKYLDPDQTILAILTPTTSGKPVSSTSFGGKESFTPEHTAAVKLPQWAAEALKRISIPKSTVDPKVFNLSNGIKLIVQQESISNTVSLYGHVRNQPDLQVPQGKEGVGQVLDQLFSYGTTSLDRLAFQKALDDITASESAGTDFSLQVLTDHFERGVQLLADNQLHPALPVQAFNVVQKQLAGTIAGQLESPDYLTSMALTAALVPKKDPTLRQGTPETVSSLTLQDVQDYYQQVFRPDMTTIVVIGDVSPEKAKEVIQKYFAEWKATGPKPDIQLPSIPVNKPSAVNVPNSSRVQDDVYLAETLELNRSNPDYYALQLGNHVLGGAFYATRLYRDLREKTGLVYTVSSSFDIGKTRAFYQVNYGCDPPNVLKARDIIVRDITEMQTTPISPEELQQARALLLREIPLAESSINSIAGGLLSRATHDLPLDEPTVAAHHYVKLTAREVQAAFARWLRPDDLVQVTEGPAPQ